MKNTRLPRWIALVAFVSASALATSCGNLFWKPEQTVLPAKRGPLAFPKVLQTRIASGNATSTLHNEEGDTVSHRWENGKLKFFKSGNRLYLVQRDTEGDVLSCTAFYFRERTFFRQKGGIPRRKLPYLERIPYAGWGASLGAYSGILYNSVNPYDSFTPILLVLTGGTADLITYPIGVYRAKKDPRRTLGLVKIKHLTEDEYPDFLGQALKP